MRRTVVRLLRPSAQYPGGIPECAGVSGGTDGCGKEENRFDERAYLKRKISTLVRF